MMDTFSSPPLTPAVPPVPVASAKTPIQSWRWQVIGGLVGSLLALGYQWRVGDGFPSLDQPLMLMQVMQAWAALGWFVLGWGLAGVFLWVDDQWSRRLYDSEPITRSVGFMVVLGVVGSFIVTTSGSALGIGLVMGLLTSLWGEVLAWQHEPLAFRQRFLHDIRPQAVAGLEQRWQGKWGLLVGTVWLGLVLLVLI